MREIWVSNGHYLACHSRCFNVQVFVGTKLSHARPISLFTSLALYCIRRLPRWLIEVPVGYHGGIAACAIIAFGPPFMSIELMGSQTSLASLHDMSSGIKSLRGVSVRFQLANTQKTYRNRTDTPLRDLIPLDVSRKEANDVYEPISSMDINGEPKVTIAQAAIPPCYSTGTSISQQGNLRMQ